MGSFSLNGLKEGSPVRDAACKDYRVYSNKHRGAFQSFHALSAALIRKLDASKNCINYGIIIFRIKLTDLQSFDFDHGRGTYLFYPKCCAYSRAALNQRQRLFE